MLRPNDDNLFDYPWLYAVEVGYWYLDEADAAHLREYLLRGGFLMVDDFHGSVEWQGFVESMQRVFPDRPIVEIADTDEVLHVLYDLDERHPDSGNRGAVARRHLRARRRHAALARRATTMRAA